MRSFVRIALVAAVVASARPASAGTIVNYPWNVYAVITGHTETSGDVDGWYAFVGNHTADLGYFSSSLDDGPYSNSAFFWFWGGSYALFEDTMTPGQRADILQHIGRDWANQLAVVLDGSSSDSGGSVGAGDLDVLPVPEPGTLFLFGGGLLALGRALRRRST